MPIPLLIAPLVLASIALTVYSLLDLRNRTDDAVKGGNRLVWAIVVLFGNTLGSIIYLSVGRQEPSIIDD